MPYPEEMVKPMRAELTSAGVQELRTGSDVETFMNDKTGTSMIIVNSVCGCAAGGCRPGAKLSLKSDKTPADDAQLPLFSDPAQELLTTLAGTKIDELTAMQAFDLLRGWKQKFGKT